MEIKIKLIRSCIRKSKKQKATVKALGFKKLNQIIIKKNNPAILGMIKKIPHMIKIIETI